MKRFVIQALLLGTFASVASAEATASSADDSILISSGVSVEEASAATELTESASDEAQSSDWDVSVMPYLWIAGTHGSIGIPRGDGDVDIDKSFTDTLGNLKFAFMGAFDVHHKGFIAVGDAIYLSVGAKAESVRDPAFATAHIDSKTFLGSLGLGYRVVDNRGLFVDLFAGGRVVSLDTKIDFEGPLTTRHASASATNVSPIIGSRIRIPISPTWSLGAYGDIGGIVTSSDVKWQAMASVQHDFSRHWGMLVGYRYLAIHHDGEDFDFDVNLSGPLLGVVYTF